MAAIHQREFGLSVTEDCEVRQTEDQKVMTISAPSGKTLGVFDAKTPGENCVGCAFKGTPQSVHFSGGSECGMTHHYAMRLCTKTKRADGVAVVWVRRTEGQSVDPVRLDHYNRIDAALRRHLSDSEYRACSESLEALFWGEDHDRQDRME